MTDLAKKKTTGFDLEHIRALVEPFARTHGAEVVAIEWKTEGHGFILRVLVDKAGSAEKKASTKDSAVDLEVCANLSRDVSAMLDTEDPIPGHYSLEVGSPGVERALLSAADYVRFEGEKAKLRLTEAVSGQKVLTGVLSGVSAGVLSLVEGSTTHSVPLTSISSARLVFELGPAPKPGKKNRK